MISAKALILSLLLTFNFAFANTPVLGQWGGEGASLWSTANGADGGFFCSFGRISEPLMMDANGRFTANGFIDLYEGTPPIKRVPAVFTGTVRDVEVEDDDDYREMKLSVIMPGREPWAFELREDEIGKTSACVALQ